MDEENKVEVEEQETQPKTKKTSKKKEEDAPKWATQMLEVMKSISEKLTEETTIQSQKEEVIQVEVPPLPQAKEELEEETQVEVEEMEEEVQKPSKKKRFLDYLF